jgi:hypothetical protein
MLSLHAIDSGCSIRYKEEDGDYYDWRLLLIRGDGLHQIGSLPSRLFDGCYLSIDGVDLV